MVKKLRMQFSMLMQKLRSFLNRGKVPYIFIIIYLAVGTALVYIFPRSLFAFLLFISSAVLIFYLKLNKAFKLGLMAFALLLLVPVVGARNIFYLEVIFQICVFAVLALGLNIVVGFAGLLDL